MNISSLIRNELRKKKQRFAMFPPFLLIAVNAPRVSKKITLAIATQLSKVFKVMDFNIFRNLPNKVFKPIVSDVYSNIDNIGVEQIKKQSEILELLKKSLAEQTLNVERQHSTIVKLTWLTIFLSFINIVLFLKDYFIPNKSIEILYEMQVKQEQNLLKAKSISDMSIRLLDLENQVKILEKENEIFYKGKILNK